MTAHILCALDLTHEDDAKKILVEADKLATLYGATLSVVTVLPDYGTSFVGSFFKEGTMQHAVDAANASLHELVKTTLPDRTGVQHIVEVGTVYEEILDAAGKADADLIIVGAHKPDFTERLLGPNSGRIARYAKASVLILRV